MELIVALTGASGVVYGIRLLEVLRSMPHIKTHLILSSWAKKNIKIETDYTVNYVEALVHKRYDVDNLAAPVSSGSFRHDGMVVAPCSMKTLSAIANGYSDNLIHRAADVAIKENRRVVLAVRETPLSVIHLENMLRLARVGVSIMPPVPAFYGKKDSVEDIINHYVGRVLDYFEIDHDLVTRWGSA